jgi:hypothetical protein
MLTIAQESNRSTAHVESPRDLRDALARREQAKRVRSRSLVQLGAAVALAAHAHGTSAAEVQVLDAAVARVVVHEPYDAPTRVPEKRFCYEAMDKPRTTIAIEAKVDDATKARLGRPEYAAKAGSVIVLHPTYPAPAAHFVQPDRPWTRCPPFPHHSRRHKQRVPRG